MSEHVIQQRILLACGNGSTRLFRNNVGTGWAGQATKVTSGNLRGVAAALRPGDVVIRQGRPLHAGLCVGSSDLIGWRSRTITPEMVGQTIAQFVAIEVKSETGRTTAQQDQFLSQIQGAGGCGGVARSVDAATALLKYPDPVLPAANQPQ
jgi:hypothetical protein